MNCKEIILLDYLFEEMEKTQRKKIDLHLSSCSTCSAELEELRSTVKIMNKWDGIEPKREMVFISPKENLFQKLSKLFSFNSQQSGALRWAGRLVVATAILAILIFRTEIRYSGGQFSLTIGSDNKTELTSLSPEVMTAFKNIQEELYYMQQMVAAGDERNRKMFISGIGQLSQQIDQQRKVDLDYVGQNIQRLRNTNMYNFERTNSLLEGIINLASTNYPERK